MQVRSLGSGGKDGSWMSTQVYSGLGSSFGDALGWRTVRLHAPKQKGRYEVETRGLVGKPRSCPAGLLAQLGRRVTVGISRSAPTYLGDGMSCTISADDENIVEYFNEIQFSDDISVIVTDTGTTFNIVISCPPAISPNIPSPNFDLSMYSSDNAADTTCGNQVPIVIPKAQLAAQNIAYCPDGQTCDFLVILSNRSTETVYSETLLPVMLRPGNQTIIPNLEPATLPFCPTPRPKN